MMYKDYMSILTHNILHTPNYNSGHGFIEPGQVAPASLTPSSDGGAPTRFPR